MINSLRSRVDRFSSAWVFLAVLLPLLGIYLATATTDHPYHIDPLTNVFTAWSLADHGSFFLDDFSVLREEEYFGNLGWVVRARERAVSQYPPGAALFATPFYLFDVNAPQDELQGTNDPGVPPVTIPIPSLVPAAVASATATAMAMALLALTLLRFATPSTAIGASYVAGLGTGAWSVASDSLWQHGPAVLWIALGVYLLTTDRYLFAGLVFALAIVTRPHTALIAAAAGLCISIDKRNLKPAVLVGFGSSFGLVALIAYNWVVFGVPSVSGGYGDAFTARAIHSSIGWYLSNVGGALFDPARGLLIWAPFLIVLSPGLLRGWRIAPAWARGAAIGGILYLLLQLKSNRFSGGSGFFAYRYPLEMLMASAPLLFLSWRHWTTETAIRRHLFRLATALAVVGQALGPWLF